MAMTYIHRIAAVMAVTVLIGCAKAEESKVNLTEQKNTVSSPGGLRLTSEEVVHIAKEAAKKEDIPLLNYQDPEVHFELVYKDRTWTMFFTGKEARPGNHFSVSVDDQTGKSQMMRGE